MRETTKRALRWRRVKLPRFAVVYAACFLLTLASWGLALGLTAALEVGRGLFEVGLLGALVLQSGLLAGAYWLTRWLQEPLEEVEPASRWFLDWFERQPPEVQEAVFDSSLLAHLEELRSRRAERETLLRDAVVGWRGKP